MSSMHEPSHLAELVLILGLAAHAAETSTGVASCPGSVKAGMVSPRPATRKTGGGAGAVALLASCTTRCPASVPSSGPGPLVTMLATTPRAPAASATSTIFVPDFMAMRPSLRPGCTPHAFGERRGLFEADQPQRSEEHTSELQSLMRISYAVFCLKQKKL